MTPFIILCAVLYLATIATVILTTAREQAALEQIDALAAQAADWAEPTRAEVEQQMRADEWADIWAAFGYDEGRSA